MPAQRGQITGDSREGGESSRTHEYSANCRTFQLKSVLGEGEGEQRGRRGGGDINSPALLLGEASAKNDCIYPRLPSPASLGASASLFPSRAFAPRRCRPALLFRFSFKATMEGKERGRRNRTRIPTRSLVFELELAKESLANEK